jgi:hypothetical protein
MCETVVVSSVSTNCLFTIYYLPIGCSEQMSFKHIYKRNNICFSLLGYSDSLIRQKSIEGAGTTGRTCGPGRAGQGRAQL